MGMTDPDEQSIVLLLKMEPGAHPPRGALGTSDSDMRPFHGWSGLASGIEAYLRPAEVHDVLEPNGPLQ